MVQCTLPGVGGGTNIDGDRVRMGEEGRGRVNAELEMVGGGLTVHLGDFLSTINLVWFLTFTLRGNCRHINSISRDFFL